MALPPGALAFASGIPLVVVSLWLLVLPPRRREHVFFGLFLLLWGAQVCLANLGRMLDDPALAAKGLLASAAVMAPGSLFLGHFGAGLLRERPARMLQAVFVGAATLATLVLLLAPETVVASVARRPDGTLATAYGPALFPLFQAPFFGAVFLTLLALYQRYREAAPGNERHRHRALLFAFALFCGYWAWRNLFIALDLPPEVLVQGPGGAGPYAAFYLLASLLVAGIATHLVLRPARPEDVDLPLLGALVLPMLVAFAELASGATEALLPGLARIGCALVLAHALARRQVFDLDLRLARIAAPTLAALALGTGAALPLVLLGAGAAPTLALAAATLCAVLALAVFLARRRLERILVRRDAHGAAQRHHQRLEVYRTHLRAALAGERGESAEGLRALRQKLGIRDEEHDVMEFMARRELALDAPTPPLGAPGTLVAGRYRIERALGEGSYGKVHLAIDEANGGRVVLKSVNGATMGGKAAALLQREADVLRTLRHPNVVAVHDVLRAGDETLVVMEYADGGSLADLLERRGRLGPAEAARILDGLLAALDAAHARGIVHLDVKPENVLLTRDGRVKLADFGVARASLPGATALATGLGTLVYMSPEQVRGTDVDARSDLYGAAVLLHQALTGRFYLPLAGLDDYQIRRAILHARPRLALPPDAARLEPVLRKALDKDPARRHQAAAELRAAVAHALRRPAPDGSSVPVRVHPP